MNDEFLFLLCYFFQSLPVIEVVSLCLIEFTLGVSTSTSSASFFKWIP